MCYYNFCYIFFFTCFCSLSAVLSDYESAEDSEVSVIGSFSFGVGGECVLKTYTPVVQKYHNLLVNSSCAFLIYAFEKLTKRLV